MLEDLPHPPQTLTERPSRYGFHATLKPPFRPERYTSESDLRAALIDFCTTHRPVQVDALELTRLGGFLALMPKGDTAALEDLAARVVVHFDPFRAPLTEAELARRDSANLSPTQRQNLAQWGYPHVMQDFRFHITLTGRFAQKETEATRIALAPHLKPLLPKPFVLEALTLCGEDKTGRFHAIERRPLQG